MGPIRFQVRGEDRTASFEMSLSKNGSLYAQLGGADVMVHRGRRSSRLIDIFKEDPPHIYFSDGDMLVDCDLAVLPRDEELPPFDPNKIEAVQWQGVDIRKEAQGPQKDADFHPEICDFKGCWRRNNTMALFSTITGLAKWPMSSACVDLDARCMSICSIANRHRPRGPVRG